MPYFSVILPVYQRQDLVSRAIDSVINQSDKDFELIIVDDGSVPPLRLPNLVAVKPQVKLLRIDKNCGVSQARNLGLNFSQGQHVCFIDSDDEWLSHKLSSHRKFIQNNPDIFWHQGEERWVRNGRRVQAQKKHLKVAGEIFNHSLHRCLISPSCVCIARELLSKEGEAPFDQRLKACEDYDLWLRLLLHAPIGLIAEDLMIRYAGHEDQLSSTVRLQDRYRCLSLKKLLKSGKLSRDQKEAAKGVYLEKRAILINGAKKRKQYFACLKYFFHYFLL